jgi:hypothetical protein
MSRAATMLRGRRLVRLLRLSLVRPAAPNTYGGSGRGAFCQALRLLPSQPGPLPGRESQKQEGRVPETQPCPLPASQSERADLGERAGGAVTPASRVVRVRLQLGRRAAVAWSLPRRCSDIALSMRGVEQSSRGARVLRAQLRIVLPAGRAAGQSKRARSGAVTHGSIAGSFFARSRSQSCRFYRSFLGGVRPWRASVRPCSSTARCGVGSVGSRRTA